MKRKWICLAALGLPLLGASLEVLAANDPPRAPPPKPVAFDDDLFRRDAPTISSHIEFLYWTIQEGALDYALKMGSSAPGIGPHFAQGKFEIAQFNWDPGFRVALSYFRAPKYWEVKGTYTRFTARGRQNRGKPEVESKFITATWPQITPFPLSGARSEIHMNYNTFDLSVDRYFNPNPHLRLRIFGGGSVAWLNQNWKIHYFDSVPNTTTVRNRWKFIGGGFKMGIMADWFWTSDIYITGLGNAGILVGSYRNRAQQHTTYQPRVLDEPLLSSPPDDTSLFLRNTDLRDTRAVFTAQLLLGPSWQKNFCNRRVELFAGYEFNAWMNLQEVYRSTAGAPSQAKQTWLNTGMVALHGLSTRLTIDF